MSSTTLKKSPLNESQLTQLLGKWDAPSRAKLDEWMAQTPYPEASEMLASILQKQQPDKLQKQQVVMLGVAVAMLFLLVLVILIPLLLGAKHHSFPGGVFGGMVPIFTVAFQQRRTVAPRAALILARRNDERAIAGLADTWMLQFAQTVVDKVVVEEQTAQLLRMLDNLSKPSVVASEETCTALRRLLTRLAVPKRAPRKDVSDSAIDVLIAAVRVLARTGAGVDRDLLARVAQAPHDTTTRTPNRDLLRDTARFCLSPTPAATQTTIGAVTAVSVSAPPAVQQLRRP